MTYELFSFLETRLYSYLGVLAPSEFLLDFSVIPESLAGLGLRTVICDPTLSISFRLVIVLMPLSLRCIVLISDFSGKLCSCS